MRKLRRAHQKRVRKYAKLKRKALKAGTAAAITFGVGINCNRVIADYVPDPHQSQVTKDVDCDYLANREEVALGYRVFNGDQNGNLIPDGVELAKRCAAEILELHWWADPDDPNKAYFKPGVTWGLETCDICGQWVNMGMAFVVNPRLGMWVECPPICLHYMMHGSFGYAGNIHNGRVDVPALLRALDIRYPYEPNEHQLPLGYEVESVRIAPDANDYDGDMLADSEELNAGFNLFDSDQDQDLNPDGVELARQCLAVFNQLPDVNEAGPNEVYKEFEGLRGLEVCEICGQNVNMGTASVTNPKLPMTVTFPVLALHYMEHGSFSYAGSVNSGRVDVPGLLKVMEMPSRCGQLGTIYLPGDHDKDCDEDFEDLSKFADMWLKSSDPDGIEY